MVKIVPLDRPEDSTFCFAAYAIFQIKIKSQMKLLGPWSLVYDGV